MQFRTYTVLSVILPDDEELNWDREILSPGEVVRKIYPTVSRSEIDRAYIGDEIEQDLEGRIVEGAVRAWISYV